MRSPRAALAAHAALLILAAAPARADIQVRARVEPEVIGADETVVLSIEVQGDSLGRLSFEPLFDLENLELVAGPSQSDNMTIVNGSFSRTVRVSWQFRPLAPGPAAVRSIRVKLRGQVLDLGERRIQVRAAGAGPSRREPDGEEDEPSDPFDRFLGQSPLRRLLEPFERRRGPRVFLRAEVQPAQPWVGQQVLYTVYLYTREDITAINPRAIPTFRGFWVRDIPQPQHLPTDMVEVDGERYGRVVLVRRALFPLRPGPHPIEPTRMELMVRRIEQGFFGPPIERPMQVDLSTDPARVDVRPLPPGPSGYAGAVGHLALSTRLEPRQLAVGEAATLTVTLSGTGHVQGVQAPALTAPAGLSLLPPQQVGSDDLSGGVVRGRQTWTYPVVPERPGRYRLELPPIFYFDPALGQYQAAAAAPLELVASPKAVVAGAGGTPALHPVLGGTLAAAHLPAWPRLAPWLFALPLGLALLVALARGRRGAEAPVLAPVTPGAPGVPGAAAASASSGGSARAARRRLEQRLAEVPAPAAAERPRQAAAAFEEAWRDFLAERWGLPPGTPSPRWAEMLAARGADAEAARELGRLADDLHYLRYAPQLSATAPLVAEVRARCQRLLRRLR